MPSVSVICVTNRPGAYLFLAEQLDKQTLPHKKYEVIVADDLKVGDYNDGRVMWFKPRQKGEGDVWNINKAYNDCLKRARGKLLVFLQDFIWIPANGLERFCEISELLPNDFFTGVGHKAAKGIEGISEVDERAIGEPGLSRGNYSHFELNWAAVPRKFMPEFDENFDKHYGGENHYVAKKIIDNGQELWIDRSNKCIGLSQEECGGRPSDWEEKHYNKLNIEL